MQRKVGVLPSPLVSPLQHLLPLCQRLGSSEPWEALSLAMIRMPDTWLMASAPPHSKPWLQWTARVPVACDHCHRDEAHRGVLALLWDVPCVGVWICVGPQCPFLWQGHCRLPSRHIS